MRTLGRQAPADCNPSAIPNDEPGSAHVHILPHVARVSEAPITIGPIFAWQPNPYSWTSGTDT